MFGSALRLALRRQKLHRSRMPLELIERIG
jgi:hypothetical protein